MELMCGRQALFASKERQGTVLRDVRPVLCGPEPGPLIQAAGGKERGVVCRGLRSQTRSIHLFHHNHGHVQP